MVGFFPCWWLKSKFVLFLKNINQNIWLLFVSCVIWGQAVSVLHTSNSLWVLAYSDTWAFTCIFLPPAWKLNFLSFWRDCQTTMLLIATVLLLFQGELGDVFSTTLDIFLLYLWNSKVQCSAALNHNPSMFDACKKEISWIRFKGRRWRCEKTLKRNVFPCSQVNICEEVFRHVFLLKSCFFWKDLSISTGPIATISRLLLKFTLHTCSSLSLFTRDWNSLLSLVMCFCPACSQMFLTQELLLAFSGGFIAIFCLYPVFFIAFYSVCFQPSVSFNLITCSQEQNWAWARSESVVMISGGGSNIAYSWR